MALQVADKSHYFILINADLKVVELLKDALGAGREGQSITLLPPLFLRRVYQCGSLGIPEFMTHFIEDDDAPSWLKGENKTRATEIAGHFAEIMRVLGLDLEDPHLCDTPDRVGRMYMEIFRGLEDQSEPAVTCFPNSEGYSNMVIVKDIDFFSVCSHHMIPFFGKAHVAYIPGDHIVGLSKNLGK